MSTGDDLMSGAAWREFCHRLAAVGERILADDFPASERDRAEGFRHLTRQLVYALQWHLELRDPAFPGFHRFDDDVTKWGGPCVDFNYLRARVSPEHAYRVTGNVTGVRQIVFALAEGEMQLEQYGVLGQWNLTQLDVGDHGELDILLAAERPPGHAGNFFPLHPGVDHLNVRVVFSDWTHDALPMLRIERLGQAGEAPGPLTPAEVARRLGEATTWIERSVPYWNAFVRSAHERVGDNTIPPARQVAGGVPDFQYTSGFWRLAPDEALIVTCDAVDSAYWSLHWYTLGWFESGDLANRSVSFTGESVHIDGDGRVRYVVAHTDPGVPNWVDTEGRERAMIAMRWAFLDHPAPVPECQVVPLDDVRQHLPADHPTVDADTRRRQLAARQAAAARRFRH